MNTRNRKQDMEGAAVMSGMRKWAVITATAILVVQVLDLAARFLVAPGWIFAFLFVFGGPVWLLSFAVLG